ncbi:MAG: DeoR/GlpR family DNA-binding transcription regulator [Verrucomicrobiales bacterium]|jgi:DeoR/GlpR family transcriptional regulator of sugar metabolism|nr:DeoR/GlpR family DNA-binding transcription regulator [Verrucomicrobiales bacterium]
MFAHERHQAIQELLAKKQRLTVGALQHALRISPATLRRDLGEMEKAGLVVRVHGGVVHPSALRGEPSFAQRGGQAVDAKREIAKATAALIPDKAVVFIDAGTTCLEVGRLLMTRKGLTLITNSVPFLSLAAAGCDAQVVSVGGKLRDLAGALTGSLALSWLASLHADVAVVSAAGLSLKDGASTTELEEAAIKQQFLARSKRRILVADRSKWNAPRMTKFAGWNNFETWVTDCPLTAAERTVLAKSKLKINQVKTDETQ